jgi:hypothetical protein
MAAYFSFSATVNTSTPEIQKDSASLGSVAWHQEWSTEYTEALEDQ